MSILLATDASPQKGQNLGGAGSKWQEIPRLIEASASASSLETNDHLMKRNYRNDGATQ